MSSNALYVYCYLSQWMNVGRRETRTTYGLLTEDVILYRARAWENKKRIKVALEELKEKNLIQVEEKKSELLYVTFTQDWDEKYTSIPGEWLDKVEPDELKAMGYILRWAKMRDQFTLHEWEHVLGVSYKTTHRKLQRMEEKGLISIKSGEYYQLGKEYRQTVNKYKVEG